MVRGVKNLVVPSRGVLAQRRGLQGQPGRAWAGRPAAVCRQDTWASAGTDPEFVTAGPVEQAPDQARHDVKLEAVSVSDDSRGVDPEAS